MELDWHLVNKFNQFPLHNIVDEPNPTDHQEHHDQDDSDDDFYDAAEEISLRSRSIGSFHSADNTDEGNKVKSN